MLIQAFRARIQQYRARKFLRNSRYRPQLRTLPTGLLQYWTDTAHHEFPGIPQDPHFFWQAAEGLLQFFACVRHSPHACALPSRAADSVWHAWLRFSPMQLQQFCANWYGRDIPHIADDNMPGGIDAAVAATLLAARHLEGMPAWSARIPGLFTLDQRLNMPGGYAYYASQGAVYWQAIDAYGRSGGVPRKPETLTHDWYFQQGWISADDHQKARDEQRRRHDTGSSDLAAPLAFGSGAGAGAAISDDTHCKPVDAGGSDAH